MGGTIKQQRVKVATMCAVVSSSPPQEEEGGASNEMRHLYFLIRFTAQTKGSHRILDNQFTSKKILPYLMVFALP